MHSPATILSDVFVLEFYSEHSYVVCNAAQWALKDTSWVRFETNETMLVVYSLGDKHQMRFEGFPKVVPQFHLKVRIEGMGK